MKKEKIRNDKYLNYIVPLIVKGIHWGQEYITNSEDQEKIIMDELTDFIQQKLEKARGEGLKDLKQELFTFFRWFQWNGEKYMDKPIEEMIKAYLEERKLGDVLGKIEKQIKLEEDKNEGA